MHVSLCKIILLHVRINGGREEKLVRKRKNLKYWSAAVQFQCLKKMLLYYQLKSAKEIF